MTPDPRPTGWQTVQDEVLRRIHARQWPPGSEIPNEVDLAAEFGCARATVNRALRALADEGILERRRKAGTRVALHPVSRATLDIPVIRQEVAARGATYGYRLLTREVTPPPPGPAAILDLSQNESALHLLALHLSDDAPYVIEDRWISLTTLPVARDVDFHAQSANEWLLAHAPYTHGDITFCAEGAGPEVAAHLQTNAGAPVFVIRRTTWDHARTITKVRLTYAPGYAITTRIGTPA